MSERPEQSGFFRVALDSIPARWAAAALSAHATLTVAGISGGYNMVYNP